MKIDGKDMGEEFNIGGSLETNKVSLQDNSRDNSETTMETRLKSIKQ